MEIHHSNAYGRRGLNDRRVPMITIAILSVAWFAAVGTYVVSAAGPKPKRLN